MSYQIKMLKQSVGWRFASMSFNGNNTINLVVEIGTTSTTEATEDTLAEITFSPIATSTYYLDESETASLFASPVSGAEQDFGLKVVLENRIENVLRAKGQLTI